jgi:FKBP-type peptidyl-prolyl cis-trans isomerase SlyD
VQVPPEQGFGDYDPDEVEWFDRDEFEDDEGLEPGMLLAVEDDDGELFDAVITEVTGDAVALDFNPPLAGKTLVFEVEVVAVRPADAAELEHGHPHSLDDDEAFAEDGDDGAPLVHPL